MDGGQKNAYNKGNKKQINRVVNDHIHYVIVWIIWMNVMFMMNDFTAFEEAYETGKSNICFCLT